MEVNLVLTFINIRNAFERSNWSFWVFRFKHFG